MLVRWYVFCPAVVFEVWHRAFFAREIEGETCFFAARSKENWAGVGTANNKILRRKDRVEESLIPAA